MSLVIVEMSNTTVCCDFGVDVTALAFIQVNFCLKNINLLRLHLQLLFKVFLQIFHLLLLHIVIIHKDSLICAIQLSVQLKLMLTLLPDHVQQICIFLNTFSQLTLSLLEVCFVFFNLTNTFLFCLLVFYLLVQNSL
jgi:hypothetical protein